MADVRDSPAVGGNARQFPGSRVLFIPGGSLQYSRGCEIDPSGVTIHAVYVDPGARRQGVATALLDALASKFHGYGCDPGGLTDDGAPLWTGWVAANGFVEVNGMVWLQDEDEFNMEGSLHVTAAPRYGDPSQHPWFQANPVHADNIINVYNRATDDDKAQGENWYHGAHLVAKAIGQGNAALGAGLLGIYSPNTPWPTNMFNAATAMEQGRGIGGKGSGFFASGSQKTAADRLFAGSHYNEVMKGPKIRDFAHLIEHDGDQDTNSPHAVIDRHAISIAVGRRLLEKEADKAPLSTDHYYKHVVNAYKSAAQILSEREGRTLAPHQIQATTWLVQQRENALADQANDGGLDRGRNKAQDNAARKWDEHARQNYPDLSASPGFHRLSTTYRRCESCGQVMRSRLHRQRDQDQKLVCDGCQANGFGEISWNVPYTAGAKMEPVVKCPSCQGQGSYEDDETGQEHFCPRCNGDGVLDAPVKTSSLQRLAHDSGDGETVAHCPMCGSGAVTGGADGTISCEFCHQHFTVQIQPEFKAMPQTVNGQPYNIPGMPGGGPDAGAAQQDDAEQQEQAQKDAPDAPAPGDSPAADSSKGQSPSQDAGARGKKPNPFSAHLIVEGGALSLDKAIQHLALKYADDKGQVLAAVRAENRR